MLTKNEANQLLTQYRSSLENLQFFMEKCISNYLRSDKQYIPNILAALESIASNKPFSPKTSSSGMSSISTLPTDPNDCINALLGGVWGSRFRQMLDFYSKEHKLDNELKKIILSFQDKMQSQFPAEQKNETPQIILYKSKNGELAVKFPNEAITTAFIEKLGGIQKIDGADKFNAGKLCPARYADNPTTLYFPAYTAKNGEFTGVFASKEMRQQFYDLLIKDPSIHPNSGSKFVDSGSPHFTPVTIDNHVIYFHSKKFFEKGASISVPVPDSLNLSYMMTMRKK